MSASRRPHGCVAAAAAAANANASASSIIIYNDDIFRFFLLAIFSAQFYILLVKVE